MEDLLIALVIITVIYGLFGVICAVIANNRGRSPLAWFFIGILTQIIGIVLVLVLPDPRVQEERRRRMMKENRRLKEALRKDRMVSDNRYVETSRRLDAHDRALDVDTSGAPRLDDDFQFPNLAAPVGRAAASPSAEGASPDGSSPKQASSAGGADAAPREGASPDEAPTELAASPAPASAPVAEKEWHYLVGDQQIGPVSLGSIQLLYRDGALDDQSYVWRGSMDDWKRIGELPELKREL